MANAAAAVGWGTTLGTLTQIIRPWRRRFGIVVTSGHHPGRRVHRGRHSRRARRRRGQDGIAVRLSADSARAGGAARRAAALARILARARHRLSAAGGDADRSVPQARHPGAGLSGAAALRRPGRARQPGCRDDRIFLRAYRGAGAGGDPGALDGAATLAVVAWPIALALLPFVLFAGLAPVLMRTRIDRLGVQARDGLGLLGAYVTETIQGLSDLVAFQAVAGRRRGFMEAGARLPAHPPRTAARSVLADGPARNRRPGSAGSRSRSSARGLPPSTS